MPEATKVHVDAGFQAEALDPAIEAARDRLTKVIADVERIRGSLEPQLDEVRKRLTAQLATGTVTDAALLAQCERLIEWLEKYARVVLNFTKVTDEAARLRSFVAGGADSRPDLSSLSDADLARIVHGERAKTPKPAEGQS